MPDSDHELWEYAASNRARIEIAEGELTRLRDRQHDLAAEVAASRHLADAVRDLAHELARMREQVDPVLKRAVRRPTVTTAQALISLGALGVALAALLVTALHAH